MALFPNWVPCLTSGYAPYRFSLSFVGHFANLIHVWFLLPLAFLASGPCWWLPPVSHSHCYTHLFRFLTLCISSPSPPASTLCLFPRLYGAQMCFPSRKGQFYTLPNISKQRGQWCLGFEHLLSQGQVCPELVTRCWGRGGPCMQCEGPVAAGTHHQPETLSLLPGSTEHDLSHPWGSSAISPNLD